MARETAVLTSILMHAQTIETVEQEVERLLEADALASPPLRSPQLTSKVKAKLEISSLNLRLYLWSRRRNVDLADRASILFLTLLFQKQSRLRVRFSSHCRR